MTTPTNLELYDDAVLYDLLSGVLAPDEEVAFYDRLLRAHGGPALELACGAGRVAVPLAARGWEVAGLDLSRPMLARAAEKAKEHGVAVAWHQGDVRGFDLGRRFGLAYLPNHTVGHLHDQADLAAFLAAARRHLLPGGRLVIDAFVPSPALLARTPDEDWPVGDFALPDGSALVSVNERVRYDLLEQLAEHTWTWDGLPAPRTTHVRLRLWFPRELVDALERHGFEVLDRFGGFDGQPARTGAWKHLVVAKVREEG